jgi:enediyne biosynthesis protein CalE5
MESRTIDAAAFRDGQQQQWDKASTAWKKYSEFIDENAKHISERLVDLAGVTAGSRVVDVAAGYGEPSLTAARVAGPEGKVVATDISAGMLAYGRERAAAEGLDNIDFVQSDAISLEFPAGSFDAAVSRWGIIFEPDGEGAAARVRSFLEPGCRMAISSWGPPDRAPFLGVPVGTVMQRLEIPPPPPGTPGPLSRPTPEAIGGLLEGGGFSDVEVEEAEVSFTFGSAEEFTTFVKEIAPPITAMMADRPQEVQDETWAAITAAVAERAGDGGSVEFKNLVLLASGSA